MADVHIVIERREKLRLRVGVVWTIAEVVVSSIHQEHVLVILSVGIDKRILRLRESQVSILNQPCLLHRSECWNGGLQGDGGLKEVVVIHHGAAGGGN